MRLGKSPKHRGKFNCFLRLNSSADDLFSMEFNKFYSETCGEIYCSNIDEKISEFSETHRGMINSLGDMSSLEMVNFVISSDDYLMKISAIVDWLKTTIEHNENDVVETLKDLANNNLKFFFSGKHLEDPNMKRLYSLLIKVLKAKGVTEGSRLLGSLFGPNNPLAQILTGGLPFIDINYYEEVNKTQKGEKAIKRFKILDYMESVEFENLGRIGVMGAAGGSFGLNRTTTNSVPTSKSNCIGNHRWLLWQFTLFQGMSHSTCTEEKKLFGHLCNDYMNACLKEGNIEDKFNFGDDSVYELFRVSRMFGLICIVLFQ